MPRIFAFKQCRKFRGYSTSMWSSAGLSSFYDTQMVLPPKDRCLEIASRHVKQFETCDVICFHDSVFSHISKTYLVPFSSCTPSGTCSPTHLSRSSLLFLSQHPLFPLSSSCSGKNVSHSNSLRTLVRSIRFVSFLSSEALYTWAPPITNALVTSVFSTASMASRTEPVTSPP